MTQPEALATLASDVRLMQFPGNTCLNCAHAECIRRRRERNLLCALCHRRIWVGQSYQVLARVAWEVTEQAHEDCLQERR